MAPLPIPSSLTADQFLAIYSEEEDGLRRFELFDGAVVERPISNRVHDEKKNVLMLAITRHVEASNSHVVRVETTFRIAPGVTFTPDGAVIEASRWYAMKENFASDAPDIAIEVVSSERADRLQFKVDSYLEYGSKAVGCIYPHQKKISVFTGDSRWTEFKGNASLEFPSILPGFSATLSVIFASVK